MIERYLDFLGKEETIKLLEANQKPLIPTIRTNTLKISPEELKKRLEKKGYNLIPINEIPYGFKVINNDSYNLGSLHEYLQGYFYLQNKASMLPALILNPTLNDIVIDMCAAPGSKSTQLAQIMKNKGILILIEKSLKRISALKINIRKMGLLNSVLINTDAINSPNLGIKANKILLDAPCTGEGLIRQDPHRKKSKKLKDLKLLATIQKKLLEAGLKSLKTGGKLLYSTCSIAPEENEEVIDEILKKMPDVSIVKISNQYGVEGLIHFKENQFNESLKYSQRIYPHIHDTIGFFLCLLEKK